MNRAEVFAAIDAERERQARKWAAPHDWGQGDCSSPGVALPVKYIVLGEEFGEVGRAILDQDPAGLVRELVQVAAVACAILETPGVGAGAPAAQDSLPIPAG